MARPAQLLERAGLPGAAERLRNLRWAVAALLPALRPRHALRLTVLWLREPLGRRAYRVLGERELMTTRRSDTVFVFGSGGSLRTLSPEDWERIAQCDVVAFSHFHRQHWIRVDYHLIAEVASIPETVASMRANPLYGETIYGMTKGWIAEAANTIVADRLLPAGTRIFRWRRIARGRAAPASRRLSDGLVHGAGSIQDVTNFALTMGWTRVVIIGADLQGKRYFWMSEDDVEDDEVAAKAERGRWSQSRTVLEAIGRWGREARDRGVELLVYDRSSLLAEVLPLFSWDDAEPAAPPSLARRDDNAR